MGERQPHPASVGPSDLLRRAAREAPERVALVDGAARYAYGELDVLVNAVAGALRAQGLAPGDRVALQLPTGRDFVTLYLGALRAGLVVVPVNPAYTAPEVDRLVTDAGATLVLDPPAAAELVATAPPADDPRADRGGEELAVLLYTSGTSGRTKGAMLSARAVLANLDQLAAVEPPLVGADDVLFVPLPMTHVFGLNAGLGMALRVGATLVVADRFDAGATLDQMAAERVTAVIGVPGQYTAWLAHPDFGRGFASVRFAMSGSATLGRGVLDGYAAAGIPLHDGYGLTEAAPVVTVNAMGTGRVRPKSGSIGRPLPGVEVQLRDADGSEVEEDDPGRIFVRGPNLFSGYWPDGADGPDADGWFGTGDIAFADEDDELHLVGRSSDLVIVNGFNVYPAEVEAVLAAQPGVAEVAVVGVRHERSGEAVQAWVVPTPGAELDRDELLAVAARSLARFKLPERIHLVDELPHTVTGKIMKWQLERAKE
jgi:long-chain acyl-CoA synthetase